VHLLCHLDSPSAASLPYLGLQEQTGPEFSGLLGSYRDFFQESSSSPAHSLTWRGRSQANKPHAVQCCVITTFHRKTQTRLSKRFSCHRIISRDDFQSRLHAQPSSAFPYSHRVLPPEFNIGISVQEMRTRNFSRTDTISTLVGPGCTRVPQHNPG
jgi:hypothetical protein